MELEEEFVFLSPEQESALPLDEFYTYNRRLQDWWIAELGKDEAQNKLKADERKRKD